MVIRRSGSMIYDLVMSGMKARGSSVMDNEVDEW